MTVTPNPVIDGLVMQLFTPEGRKDPYPLYASIRAEGKVSRSNLGPFVVCGYDECLAIFRDARFGRGVDIKDTTGLISDSASKFFAESDTVKHNVVLADPPDHTRLRKLVSRWFTPRAVEGVSPALHKLIDGLVDAMAEKGEVDFLTEFAEELPMCVVGERLGVPATDLAELKPYIKSASQGTEPLLGPEESQEAAEATQFIEAYVLGLLEDRRRHPADDLLTGLVQTQEQTDGLSDQDITVTAVAMFVAGFTTMSGMLGNGMVTLLRHPDQVADWRAHPEITPTAVEELMRFNGPLWCNFRRALEPADICGEPLVRGDFVLVIQDAGNHDPARFTDPDRLDLRRENNAQLSFGGGMHYCLGANLGRAQAGIAFTTMLARFQTIEMVGDPEWKPAFMRGVVNLPIKVS